MNEIQETRARVLEVAAALYGNPEWKIQNDGAMQLDADFWAVVSGVEKYLADGKRIAITEETP
jgi:hypothetical protein